MHQLGRLGILCAHARQVNHEGSDLKRHLLAVRDVSDGLGLQQRQGIVPRIQLDAPAQGQRDDMPRRFRFPGFCGHGKLDAIRRRPLAG